MKTITDRLVILVFLALVFSGGFIFSSASAEEIITIATLEYNPNSAWGKLSISCRIPLG